MKTSHNPKEVYTLAKAGILKQDNLVLLEPMYYQNTYALAVSRKIAKQYNLKTISDLKKAEKKLKAGFTLEFNDRQDGGKGLAALYGLHLTTATLEPSLRYQAIQSGDIHIIDAYSTDPEITKYDLVVLKDDKQLFPPYQGAPLMKKSLLKKYPELKNILNKLSGQITEAQMSQMNYQTGIQGKPAISVAREFLIKHGYISSNKK